MRLLLVVFFLPLLSLQADQCTITRNDTIVTIVPKCHGAREFHTDCDRKCVLDGMSQDDFDKIFAKAEFIYGWLEFKGSTATHMKFSSLVSTAVLVFIDNLNLKNIEFPLLETTDAQSAGLLFERNPKLEILEFPTLQKMFGSFRAEQNPALKLITMSQLEYWKAFDLVIKGNDLLEEVQMTFVTKETFEVQYLRIEHNKLLKDFKVTPQEHPLKVTHDLIIKNNNKLSMTGGVAPTMHNLIVRGNPSLPEAFVKYLKTFDSGEFVQDVGECQFHIIIKDLSLLDDCVYVYAALYLDSPTTGSTSRRLTHVDGDVYTENEPAEKLAFLYDADIYRQFETNLCDFNFSLFKSGKKGKKPKHCSTTTELTTDTSTTEATSPPTTTETTAGITAETTEVTLTKKNNGHTTEMEMTVERDIFPYREVIIGIWLTFVALVLLAMFWWHWRTTQREDDGILASEASSFSQR